MISIFILSSCSLDVVRDAHELDKVKSRKEISKSPFEDKGIVGKTWYWFFDEYEVELAKTYSANGFEVQPGSKVFFDLNGNYTRGLTSTGQFFYDTKETKNPKIKILYSNNFFVPNDSSWWRSSKYSLFPRGLPNEFTNQNVIVEVGNNFACDSVIKLIAIDNIIYNKIQIYPKDVITLKSNKVWKINSNVIDNDLNKDLCVFIRKSNYTIEY